MKATVYNKSILVALNGQNYVINTEWDEGLETWRYEIKDLCLLLNYKNDKRALKRLIRHDLAGENVLEQTSQTKPIVQELIRMAPTHYAQKILDMFNEQVFPLMNQSTIRPAQSVHDRYISSDDYETDYESTDDEGQD